VIASLEHHESLVDKLLAEQGRLGTAAARFSGWHESTGHAPPLQAKYYSKLIPLAKPQKDEQYAFEVNLDQCTGCKACLVACHSLNGLDEDESWRDIGMLVGDECTSYQQTITSACHHCEDPACANGCPVLAYEKDAVTGIVRHLDDQCIGCSYCILKCPYDVPKFNTKRGIVRKCDMCHGRLASGEAPACVQACPNEAIAIRIVKTGKAREQSPAEVITDMHGQELHDAATDRLLPGLVSSNYTHPTTRYLSAKPVPATADAIDSEKPRVEVGHEPLALMLVLTQFATGAILFSRNTTMLWIGLVTGTIGIMASVAHLGQPLKAFRCFLGWRKSWLSREILAFGGFPPAAAAAALGFAPVWAAAMAGLVSVFCSVMVYVDTRRPMWAMKWTAARFFGTVVVGGGALRSCFDATYATTAAVHGLIKLGWESLYLSSPDERDKRSLRLLLGPLRWLHVCRFSMGLAGISILLVQPLIGFALIMTGELLERLLFFRAAAAWKMPGPG